MTKSKDYKSLPIPLKEAVGKRPKIVLGTPEEELKYTGYEVLGDKTEEEIKQEEEAAKLKKLKELGGISNLTASLPIDTKPAEMPQPEAVMTPSMRKWHERNKKYFHNNPKIG